MKHHVLIVFRGRVCNSTSQVSLLVDPPGTSAYLRADVAEQCVLLKYKEVCSFGSGTWYDNTNAKDIMENGDKWLKMAMTFDSLLIVEKKKIPGHLAEVAILDKVVTLREALLCFQDAGEAFAWSPKVAVTR